MPINPPAPTPPIQKRAYQTVRNMAYRYHRALWVALFGLFYIVGVGLADYRVVPAVAFAYITGALVAANLGGKK